jgi:hypothetical protein
MTSDLDDNDAALVARVRALRDDGAEPDWAALEANIREQTRALPMHAPWWRRWQLLVPIAALAATAAIALVVMHRPSEPQTAVVALRDAGTPDRNPIAASPGLADESRGALEHGALGALEHGAHDSVWLDGEAIDLDESVEPEALDSLAPPETAALDTLAPSASAPTKESADEADDSILPVADYGWIDSLDDADVARLETLLARKRS